MATIIEMLQQYGPIFGVLTALATILGLVFTIYKTSHKKEIAILNGRIKQLKEDLAKFDGKDPDSIKQLNAQLTEQLNVSRNHAASLAKGCIQRKEEVAALTEKLNNDAETARQIQADLSAELESAREASAARDQTDFSRANIVRKALRLEGRIWMRKVLGGAPKFRPLHERHTAVISVLNLKGGVGKTTVAAHLGAAFSASGYRALLVDLDLQGSLSSLFINQSILKQRADELGLLQHYLTHVAEKRKANVLDFCVPILDGKSAILPTADSMAYAEMTLTMRWLLRLGKKDNRFLLRRALHQKRVTRKFDIVLLDCPPVFNTCCVNALAASDYIIIPVLPSRKAAERVPLLLDRVKELCRVVNPELQVAGVLLNRTHGDRLTAWETDLWRDMLGHCQDQWKLPVHAFQTFIRQTTEVRDSETEFVPPTPGSELHTTFSRLQTELEERLPRDCRRLAAVSLGSE